MTRFSTSFRKLALGATGALAAISLSPGSAQAIVVTVGGAQYDVTTFTGSADANAVKFNTPANGGMMPWYGNGSLAIDFALAVQGVFGNRTVYATNYTFNPNPLDNTNMAGIFWDTQYGTKPTPVPCLNCFTGGGTGGAFNEKYAVATKVPSAVPGPLPLFGAAAAFGFSRKLRKRIKLAPVALGSGLPQA
jgi:hypothetical protein